MNKKELKKGKVFKFIDKMNFVEAEVAYVSTFRGDEYAIWFNGKLIKTAKTYKAVENKIEQLKTKYLLTEKF